MNKNIVKALMIFIIGLLLYLSINYTSKENKIHEDKNKTNNNLFAMMIETSVGTGEYTQSSSNEWITDGYSFNSELSKCENGGTLSWDDTNKKVIMESNITDKCYVYFDIYVESRFDENCDSTLLACNIAKKYTGTQGNNGIYYHDSTLENGAGDNSYRYADVNPSNYVCFGSDEETCPVDNLYRIIGVFDGRVKLIKADYATSALLGTDGDYKGTYSESTTNYKGSISTSDIGEYYWNYNNDPSTVVGSNTWSTSLLNKTNLNTNYLNNIGNKWAEMIDITTWKVGGGTYENIGSVIPSVAYQNEIVNPAKSTTYEAKVGLMYASDYGFAVDSSAWTTDLRYYNQPMVIVFNWMYMGLFEWIISPDSSDSGSAFRIDDSGYIYDSYYAISSYSVRPVFYLNASVKYVQGRGTKNDPVRITY